MRHLLVGLLLAGSVAVIGGAPASAAIAPGGAAPAGAGLQTLVTADLYHGGGCRKSSPPGQCCHKDHSTGLVHCH